MTTILVLGAGRSSSELIRWLLKNRERGVYQVRIGDVSLHAARSKADSDNIAIEFNIENKEQSRLAIRSADIVVSVLPANLHTLVAQICLEERKHLLTASYVSPEMQALDHHAKKNDLLFLNECGLDPGLDHMSALQLIDRIKSAGGKLISFESFTGGLISPDTDPGNPWRYKFTWSPRNVVMAGVGTAKFLQRGQHKYIPYQQLFKQLTAVSIPGQGEFEGYMNRDSLKYRSVYGLDDIQTMIRGTLRNKGFCSAWNLLVQLGCTDDAWTIEDASGMTHRDFVNSFLPYDQALGVEKKIIDRFNLSHASDEMHCLKWSGFFDAELVGLDKGTPAQILEHILNKRWELHPQDKDLVVMWHRFIFEKDGTRKAVQCSLAVTGKSADETAMAKTVGLPLAIAAVLLLQGKIRSRGVVIPAIKEIYDPVLRELRREGISLLEF